MTRHDDHDLKIWIVWDPATGRTVARGPQRTRPREHQSAVVVDHYPANDPAPQGNDARAWDAWRARRGYSGDHH